MLSCMISHPQKVLENLRAISLAGQGIPSHIVGWSEYIGQGPLKVREVRLVGALKHYERQSPGYINMDGWTCVSLLSG
jgi:hypothetical protein